MALTLETILSAIDEMELYKKDYDIIRDLLDKDDNEFFTKVLEEVLLGNLYWSDFEENLANTNYPDVLRKELKAQRELGDTIRKLISLRKTINEDYEYSNSDSLAFVSHFDTNIDSEQQTKEENFYNSETEEIRGNILYELTAANPNDNVLQTACKTRLYNIIKNGQTVLKYQKEGNIKDDGSLNDFPNIKITDTEIQYGAINYIPVENPIDRDTWKYFEIVNLDEKEENITYINVERDTSNEFFFKVNNPTGDPSVQGYFEKNEDKYSLTEDTSVNKNNTYYQKYFGYIEVSTENNLFVIPTADVLVDKSKTYYTASQKKYEYINPNDIFLHIDNYIIPIHADYQVLNEFDKAYMNLNNINEDTMKQIKMVTTILRRDNPIENIIQIEEE